MINRLFRHWPGLLFFCVSWACLAQPAPLQTLRNTPFSLPAVALTSNGIPGLTNVAPHLTVSGVSAISTSGGSVAIMGAQVWVNRFDDPFHFHDFGAAEAIDSAANLIVLGSSYGLFTGYDAAIIKYAGDGTPLWTNFYNGPANLDDFGSKVRVDAADNIYADISSANTNSGNGVTLIKYSSAGIPLWTNLYNPDTTNLAYATDFAVDTAGDSFALISTYGPSPSALTTVKYDTLGHSIWTNVFHGPVGGPDSPQAMALDAAGNVFVTGGSEGNTGEEWATIKYSGTGTPLWTNRYGGDVVDQPAAMAVDHAGNVIVTGDALSAPAHSYVTIEYSNNGSPLWTNISDGPNYQGGNVPEVAIDISNNVFITGGTPDADVGNADFTIVKLSGTGAPIWTNRFFDISIGNSAPAGSVVDAAGNFYMAGHSTGAAQTNIDYVTVKYSGAGVPLWTNRYDDPNHGADYAEAVVADGAGNVYVTGQSTGSFYDLDFATVKYSDYLVYSPPTNFVGTDTFTFSVVDAFGNHTNATATVTVVSPGLRFNTSPPNLTFSPQGLRLEVDGALGTNPVVLLASTNLIQWLPIMTNTPVLGSTVFLDTGVTNLPKRFYRSLQAQ